MYRVVPFFVLLFLAGIGSAQAHSGDSCSHPIQVNLCTDSAFVDSTHGHLYYITPINLGNRQLPFNGNEVFYQINLPTSSYQPVSLKALLTGNLPNCFTCPFEVYFLWYEDTPCSTTPSYIDSFTMHGSPAYTDTMISNYPVSTSQSSYYLVIAFNDQNQNYNYSLRLGFTNNQPLPAITMLPLHFF